MKKILVISLFVTIIVVSGLMTSCTKDSGNATADQSTQETSSIKETTVIIETTVSGGVIEKDSEDNKITKDEKGKVIAVEDKNGQTLVVTEYLKTHSYVEYSGNSNSSSDKSSASDPGSGNDNKRSEESTKNESSSSVDDDSEGNVPIVIATLPDDNQLKDVPDL